VLNHAYYWINTVFKATRSCALMLGVAKPSTPKFCYSTALLSMVVQLAQACLVTQLYTQSFAHSLTRSLSHASPALSLLAGALTHSLAYSLTHSLTHSLTNMQIIKPQADEQLSTLLSSSQWGLGPMCQSPGPWGTEQQQPSLGGTTGAPYGGLPAGGSTKKSGLGQVGRGLVHAIPPCLDALLRHVGDAWTTGTICAERHGMNRPAGFLS
jgi:hypothetical protein